MDACFPGPRRPLRALAALAFASSFTSGCSSPPSPPPSGCVEGLDLSCAPLYEPTFDQVYTRTLHPTCAQAGMSCHSAEGRQGGLAFDDPDEAYAALLGKDGSRARVTAGDAACSLLVERLESSDAKAQMPPGAPLAGAERCAVEQWIQKGAMR